MTIAAAVRVGLAGLACAGLVTGCGSGGEEAGRPADLDHVVEITADPGGSLAFQQSELDAAAGRITIGFENPSGVVHDVVIEGPDGNRLVGTDRVTKGSVKTSVKLGPGAYTFFCSVTGHRTAGMEGILEVK